MRSAAALFMVTLLASLSLAGCIAPPDAAGIPESALNEKDWRAKSNNDADFLRGAVKVYINEYEPESGYRVDASLTPVRFGGIHVITTRSIPVVDEAKFLEPLLTRILESEGISLGEAKREAFSVADGHKVTSTVYPVKGGPADADLRVVPISCDDDKAFVAAIGWGTKGQGFRDASHLLGKVPCP